MVFKFFSEYQVLCLKGRRMEIGKNHLVGSCKTSREKFVDTLRTIYGGKSQFRQYL